MLFDGMDTIYINVFQLSYCTLNLCITERTNTYKIRLANARHIQNSLTNVINLYE